MERKCWKKPQKFLKNEMKTENKYSQIMSGTATIFTSAGPTNLNFLNRFSFKLQFKKIMNTTTKKVYSCD